MTIKDFFRKEWSYLLMQVVITAILIVAFWIGFGRDAIGFSVIAIYFVMPVSIFILSYYMARTGQSYRIMIKSLLFGLLFMTLEYLTFSLANMLSFERFNFPELVLMFAGTLISAVAMLISMLIKKKIKG
ncbi:MAG: hypothetical protein II749_03405 [Clostridia bacterium]|nr:hypothetical protein [Clostridia bacterium]